MHFQLRTRRIYPRRISLRSARMKFSPLFSVNYKPMERYEYRLDQWMHCKPEQAPPESFVPNVTVPLDLRCFDFVTVWNQLPPICNLCALDIVLQGLKIVEIPGVNIDGSRWRSSRKMNPTMLPTKFSGFLGPVIAPGLSSVTAEEEEFGNFRKRSNPGFGPEAPLTWKMSPGGSAGFRNSNNVFSKCLSRFKVSSSC
jgi:hypothetical protein